MVTPGGQRAGGRVLARRYHLQRVLGRGAMGAVWEAEDTFLRRTVAVKEVVLPGSLSPEERAVSCERTLREARAIARLGHPNVVTLFDVLDEDARPWVVMELVPSRSLAEVIKEDGPLHPLRVATVGLAILGALEAAHAAGITHRDVKPGNILLGHDGRVKLTDFGIARAAGDDTITGTGLLVGSPSYIAPEIVKGLEAGAPADLWGLGATLYAAVEGRAPFSGADAMETLSKVVQEPAAPYERAGALVPALDAMLEKDPVRRARPVDARRALLDVLRGGSDAEARPAAPPPAPTPAPAESPAAASGPGLADLLVPVWRQGRQEEPAARSTPAAAASSGTPAGAAAAAGAAGAAGTAAAAETSAGTVAGQEGTAAGQAGTTAAAETSAGTVAGQVGTAAGQAGTAAAPSGLAAGTAGSPTGTAAGGSGGPSAAGAAGEVEVGTDAGDAASGAGGAADASEEAGQSGSGVRPIGGLAAAAGAAAPRPEAAAGAAPEAGAPTTEAPRSVAGSTVSERAREVLADDEELVDLDVADPDLVGLEADDRPDLGLPASHDSGSAGTGQAAAAAGAAFAVAAGAAPTTRTAPADTGSVTAPAAGAATPIGTGVETEDKDPQSGDSEATVTLPARPQPAGTPVPPRTPAYGSYGGGSDADLNTQRIAPLPFGPPPTQQQPARAFRPQPPSSPLDFQDERPRGDRRKRGAAALLVVMVLVVGLVLAGGFLLVRGLRGNGSGPSAGGTPSPTASLGPATIPSGFTRYVGSDFTVGVPKTWAPPKDRGSGIVDAREPGTTRFLRLITADSTRPALSQLSAAEKQFSADSSYGDYRQVKLQKVDYRGLDAADWEFTFTLDGIARHVLYRGIVTDGRTFGLYLSTPADQWTKSTDVFQVAANTFRTG